MRVNATIGVDAVKVRFVRVVSVQTRRNELHTVAEPAIGAERS